MVGGLTVGALGFRGFGFLFFGCDFAGSVCGCLAVLVGFGVCLLYYVLCGVGII